MALGVVDKVVGAVDSGGAGAGEEAAAVDPDHDGEGLRGALLGREERGEDVEVEAVLHALDALRKRKE